MSGPFCRCAHSKALHRFGDGNLGCGSCPCKGFSPEAPHHRFFDAYAEANGRDFGEQLAHDAARFPGARMAGFIAWVALRRAEFEARNDVALVHELLPEFERFLWSDGHKPSVALDGIAEVSP